MEGMVTMDIISYAMGHIQGEKDGEKHVTIEGSNYTFTDENTDGNIVIEEDE